MVGSEMWPKEGVWKYFASFSLCWLSEFSGFGDTLALSANWWTSQSARTVFKQLQTQSGQIQIEAYNY
jgi:hypothetical protein